MKLRRTHLRVLFLMLACGPIFGCSSDNGATQSDTSDNTNSSSSVGSSSYTERCNAKDTELGITRPAGWDADSHCKYAPADIAKVFPSNQVPKMLIKMTAQEYANLLVSAPPEPGGDYGDLSDLEIADADEGAFACDGTPDDPSICSELAGMEVEDGGGLYQGTEIGEALTDPCGSLQSGDACMHQGNHAGMCLQTTGPLVCQTDQFDPVQLFDEGIDNSVATKPPYFRADIEYQGAVFTSVGIRYKGFSSLAASPGEKKPLRLKLDEWEDDTPEITDQRLFGFQHLSFAPNNLTDSQLNQVIAASTFRDNGVPAPQSSFVEVVIEAGDTTKTLGVYAMTEVPDKPLLERFFGGDDGNMYKPDGPGAYFGQPIFKSSFETKSKGETDHSDVEKFINALHANRQDRSAWRANLEAAFDMHGFIDFIATNQAIGNWDTYGGLPHNMYLYTDEESNQVNFIPWDFDLSFADTEQTDFTLRTFTAQWPLLQAIARDVEYMTLYQERLRAIANIEFASEKMIRTIDEKHQLIKDAVTRENQSDPGRLDRFNSALIAMKEHVEKQEGALAEFLTTQTQVLVLPTIEGTAQQ